MMFSTSGVACHDNIEIFTFDYATGSPTHRKYSKAKIIDMIKNIEGLSKTLSAQKRESRLLESSVRKGPNVHSTWLPQTPGAPEERNVFLHRGHIPLLRSCG